MWVSLNEKQKTFAREYLLDKNATQAAIRAGYSPKTAGQAAHKLLKKAEIRALVVEKVAKAAEKLDLKGENVLAELAHFAHADIIDAFCEDGTLKHLADMPEHLRRAIKSIEFEELWEGDKTNGPDGESKGRFIVGRVVKLQMWDKPKGLELLGKHLKLFTDRLEVEGKVSLEQLVAEAAKK